MADAGKMVPPAAESLKEFKSPLKIRPVTQSLNFSKDVLKAAGEELVYQGKLIASKLQQ